MLIIALLLYTLLRIFHTIPGRASFLGLLLGLVLCRIFLLPCRLVLLL